LPSLQVRTAFQKVRFQCQRCGSCCHHRRPEEFGDLVPLERLQEFWARSNLIYLTGEDIERISRRSRLTPGDFMETLYPYDGCPVKVQDSGRKVILDLPVMRSKEDTACVFYDRGCKVYPVRPRACRLFPFRVEEETTAEGDIILKISYNPTCPGIGKGELVDKGRLEGLVLEQFLQRSESVLPEIQRLAAEGRIQQCAQVYRTLPGRRLRGQVLQDPVQEH
jgi:Fe-S-cluster containining protein